jgi:hypothetical protein
LISFKKMKEKYQKFLLFSFVFFVSSFLLLLDPQIVKALTCNNGPNNNDGGGCGTPCHCGQPWTLYDKDIYGEQFCQTIDMALGGYQSFISKISEICPTGDVCRLGEYGLRCGYCDCSFGPIYKVCCVGSTKVKCERYPGYKEVWQKGRCPAGSTTVNGTSCPSGTVGSTCGQLCAANGCNACACDGDYRNPQYSWSSLGSSTDCSICYCGRTSDGGSTPAPTAPPNGGSTLCTPNACVDSCHRCSADGESTGLDYTCSSGIEGWCACATQYNYPPGWEDNCGGGSAPPPAPTSCSAMGGICAYNGTCPTRKGYKNIGATSDCPGGCCACP